MIFKSNKYKISLLLSSSVILLSFFLFYTNPVLGAAEHTEVVNDFVVKDFIYRCFNFAVFLAILVVVIKKTAVINMFSTRREEIRRKYDELKRQKAEFESKYKELENKLKAFELQKKEILEQFRLEGEKEKKKIIEDAQKRAEQIITQADKIIEREIAQVKNRLREDIVDIATAKALEIVSQKIENKDHDYLFNEFINEVENLH